MNLSNEEQLAQVTTKLRVAHGELLKIEQDGFEQAVRDNPALIGDYLIKLRLNCNLLFAFQNKYLEALAVAIRGTAEKQQNIYEQQLALKKSENMAKNHSGEMTRVDNANIKVLENKVQQIRNEYSRYDGICMALQSRLKEFNTERMAG